MVESRLKAIMAEKGMTTRGLIAATGLSSQTVNRARGPRIADCRISTLSTIAAALGVGTKDLYEERPGDGQQE